MNALILVDLQNDFCPGGALAVPGGDQLIPLANHLMEAFGLVVATQDWHPRSHGSFAENHEGKNSGDSIMLNGLPQILWPVHCVQGTPGAEFVKGLRTRDIRRVFQKGIDPRLDSYSGFFDNGHRRATGLGDYLEDQGVTDVYVLGLATDFCVKHTALDAVKIGFRTHIVEDACRGVELAPGDIANAIEELKRAGVVIMGSPDVLR